VQRGDYACNDDEKCESFGEGGAEIKRVALKAVTDSRPITEFEGGERVVFAVEIEAKLSGPINESSILVGKGFYRSIDETVIWSQDRNPVFESVRPGESGRVSFRVASTDFIGSVVSNPEVVVDVSVRGRRLSETNVSEEVVSSATSKIRLNSELSLLPRIVHFSGPISNSGSIPPKADEETTYTVIWTLSNTINNVSNAVVSTTLPSYVRWAGNISPSNEQVSDIPCFSTASNALSTTYDGA